MNKEKALAFANQPGKDIPHIGSSMEESMEMVELEEEKNVSLHLESLVEERDDMARANRDINALKE